MTIQEMFNLLRDYRNAVNRVNNHNNETLTPELRACITEEYHLALKVADYLPMFTPIDCKHCIYNGYFCKNQKTEGVCMDYTVSKEQMEFVKPNSQYEKKA